MSTRVASRSDLSEEPMLRDSLAPLLLISLAIFSGFTVLQSFGIMAETAKTEMHLSDSALAAVQGVSAAVALVLFSIPIGILVDRRNRVRILIAMDLTWTIGTFITAASPNVTTLFFSRMLVGIGTTGALTAVLSLSSDYCRPEQRGRALLIPNFTKTAGIAAGFTIAGLLMQAFLSHRLALIAGASAWRTTQYWLGIGSAFLILPLFLLSEPHRHEVEASSSKLRIVLGELWQRRRWVIPLFIGQVTVVMADAAAGIWASPILERTFHLQPGDFAGWLGALVFGTGIVGSIIGGLVADWGQNSRIRGGLMIGAIVAAALGVPSALFPILSSVPLFGIAIGALMLAGSVTGIVASVALMVWLPNELRGLSIGAFITFAGLIGFGIAPSLVAALSGWMGGETHLAAADAIVGVGVSLISVAGFSLAMCFAPAQPAKSRGSLQ